MNMAIAYIDRYMKLINKWMDRSIDLDYLYIHRT